MNRLPYPTDLTNEQWKFIEPFIPAAKPGGRPENHRDAGGHERYCLRSTEWLCLALAAP